jgi:hypothetical protein
MTRCRFLLTGALTAGVVFVPTTSALASTNLANLAAPTCTDSWRAPVSGGWSDAADWTNGIPGEAGPVAACITVPGTYTVTLAPWSIGTADPNHQFAAITSLTLGAASGPGKQALVVLGQSSPNNSNEQVNTTGLSTTAPSLITAHGRLVLSSTDGGEKAKGVPYGGDAVVSGGPFTNYGAVTMMVQNANNKAADYTQFYSALTNEPKASVTDQSGLLDVNSVTNDGTWTVAPGASMDLAFQTPGSGYAAGVFTNSGTVTNSGAISAQAGTWSQLGGAVAGNAVALQVGTKLVDHAGAAKFVVNASNASLVGTVPKSQTITVVGEVYGYQGENYNSTTLGLGGTTVVNNGTIVLDAQGPKTGGGAADINDGTLRNNGAILAKVHGSAWTVNWQIGLTNNRSGKVTVTGGMLNESGGGSDANAGTVTVAPGATWFLQQGSAFTNQPGGTIVTQVAGPTRFGRFQMVSPCCNGAGAVNAGGALVPVLVGGYRPPGNKEFPIFQLLGGKFAGTFSRVRGGFAADYKHETSTPAFVGVIYKSTKLKRAKI